MNDFQRGSRKSAVGRGRRVARRAERLEADGITHRRDCECARCDAGFVPSEGERRSVRQSASRRDELARARAAAARARARALQRRLERERLRQLDLQSFFARSNAATDAEIARLRALRARALEDRRLDLLLGFRNAGLSLAAAIAAVDRANLPEGSAPDNDNASDHADGEAPRPVRSPTPAVAHPHPSAPESGRVSNRGGRDGTGEGDRGNGDRAPGPHESFKLFS